MTTPHPFDQVARLAGPGDNVAIALHTLAAGSTVVHQGRTILIPHTILEGHRFALTPIPAGQHLLSWNLPFGKTTTDVEPGDYICNEKILEALGQSGLELDLPPRANFVDEQLHYHIDEAGFTPGKQVELLPHAGSFQGIARSGGRGVGTRNFLVVLGTSSRVAALARTIAESFADLPGRCPAIDGIVPVTHTEGGMAETPHNVDFVLRTLAGFLVHPNVAAAVILDEGSESVNNHRLEAYMREHGYPLDAVPHDFISVNRDPDGVQTAARDAILARVPAANAAERTTHSLKHLRLALQCGGSDAFSGISANPLVGWVNREILRHGGSACIAETTELIGAESYMLEHVRDLETAQDFLAAIKRFRELAGWHGHTPEGNPSGGNRLRGLYNIIVKSIGAAMKKDPAVRLDYSIPYSSPMTEPGFYFMDSPGNDLESVAGQVAGGSNLIFFTTGNGSITNFPFVPTIKIVTTTGRYEMLKNEMDVNAGAYLDGESMDDLGRDTFALTLEVAGGRRTAGERAGHSQVQIWRNWQQDGSTAPDVVEQTERFAGNPAAMRDGATIPVLFPKRGPRVGLILPNSLCSGQVADGIARRMEKRRIGKESAFSSFVALPHTEGCGCHAADTGDVAGNTLINYVLHPHVAAAMFLEHGCEKYQNTYFQNLLREKNISADRFGWSSIQLDGGIAAVADKIEDWFAVAGNAAKPEENRDPLTIGLHLSSADAAADAAVIATVCRSLVGAGGNVILTASSSWLENPGFAREVFAGPYRGPTLAYGSAPAAPGFHVMDVPSLDDADTLSGLGATGVEVIVWHSDQRLYQTHPFIPVLQSSVAKGGAERNEADVCIDPDGDTAKQALQWYERVAMAASGEYIPRLLEEGTTAFQLSRGRLGISL